MKKLIFLSIGILAFVIQNASAQKLFTTYEDFAGWTGQADAPTTAGQSTAWDFDGVTINGLGNNGNAGGAGTAGSLAIQGIEGPPTNNWTSVAWSPGEAWLPLFMHAVDPGSLAAWTEESGWGNGTTVEHDGILRMTYTFPDNEGGSYFQLGVAFNYNNHWNDYWGSSVAYATVNGQDTTTVEIPYHIYGVSAGITYFSMGIMYSSDYAPVLPFYVDSIEVVPEPSTLALVGLGALGLALLRRRI